MLCNLRETIAPVVLISALTVCNNAHADLASVDPQSNEFDIPKLVSQLKDDNVEMRRNAAQTLGAYAGIARVGLDDRAVAALTTSLQDKDSKVRMWSIYALMYSGRNAKSAIPQIIRLLVDADAEVRQASARVFSYHPCDDKQVYVALQKALTDDDLLVRVRSAWAVLLVNPIEDAAMSVLANGLKAEDAEIRGEVVFAFGEIGLSGVPVLKVALKEKNPNFRLAAIQAMAKVAVNLDANKKQQYPIDAIQSLIALLRHEQKETVYSAVYALGVIGEPAKAAVPGITELLKDPDWSVRWIAASELRVFGSSAKVAIPALTQALEDQNWQVRRAAKESLQQLQR